MSKDENATNETKNGNADAKKLALRVKTLEAQLRQSVPKKEHHEVVSKLEKKVDELEEELDRAKEDNAKTIAINKQVSGVETLINSLSKVATSQSKVLDSIEESGAVRGKALGLQGRVLETLVTKITQGTVPSQVHLQTLSKIRELEEERRETVKRSDYALLEAKCEELSRQVSAMVPSADYRSLKGKFDSVTAQVAEMVPASDYATIQRKVEELEGAIYTMVPREKLVATQERVKELEARLAEHVPQSTYDELVARVVSLAEAITGGELQPEAQQEAAEQEVEAAAPLPAEATPEPEIEATPEQAAVATPEPAVVADPEPEVEEPTIEAPEAPQPVPVVQVEAVAPTPAPVVEAPQPVPVVQVEAVAPTPVGEPAPAAPEIREVGSQLAEISAKAQEAREGDSTVAPAPEVPAFVFSGTDVSVRTGTEFAATVEKMPVGILETHSRSGDFERWFAGSLTDGSTAESLGKVREGGATGEELRGQLRTAVAKYAEVAPAVQQAPPA